MRERRYDQLIQHKADHERLLDEIRDIMDDFEEHESPAPNSARDSTLGFRAISRPTTHACIKRLVQHPD